MKADNAFIVGEMHAFPQLCLVCIFFMYVLCMYCLKTYEEEKNHFVFH